MWEPGRGLVGLAEACMVEVHRNCHVYGAGGAMVMIVGVGGGCGAAGAWQADRRAADGRMLELRR